MVTGERCKGDNSTEMNTVKTEEHEKINSTDDDDDKECTETKIIVDQINLNLNLNCTY